MSAGVFNGALHSRQSGINSFSARGSNTAPDNICAPTSEPFSTTHTRNVCLLSCCKRIAAGDNPEEQHQQ